MDKKFRTEKKSVNSNKVETTKYGQCARFNGIDLSCIPFRSFTRGYTVVGISHTVRYQLEITTSYQYMNQNKHSTS